MPIEARDLALIVVQLILCIILVWQFELEAKRHLLMALFIASAGFVVNVRLRPAWRPAWFALVSAASVAVVLGVEERATAEPIAETVVHALTSAAAALGIAAAMIAVAAIPMSYWPRVGVVLLIAGGLTWMRSESTAIFWPIVGSMFMFRMIAYLHALRHERAPRSLPEICSYFLMLPNAFFPLFPVVDAEVFRDTWYNDEPRVIYQTGLHWIATGLLHLFVYRVIKCLLPSPLEVRSVSDLMLYLMANYGLYVRVSGQFHIACGILHLFGWNMPRTHDHYFLAASVSEIWRRINIYWKEFLTKTCFFPAYFLLRRTGLSGGPRHDAVAIGFAALWVFTWTWLAHSWQTFWLRGSFPLRAADAVMWLTAGVVVAGSMLVDYRRALRGRSNREIQGWMAAAIRSIKTIGVFLLISLFWARWSNAEVFEYLMYSGAISRPDGKELRGLFLSLLAVFLALAVYNRFWFNSRSTARSMPLAGQGGWGAAGCLSGLIAAVLISTAGNFIDESGHVGAWLHRLRREHPSAGEAMAVIDGYYEELNDTSGQAGPYLAASAEANEDQRGGRFTAALRSRSDILQYEPIPGWHGEFEGAPLSFNRWGMRDGERSLLKQPDVYRIALVGSSIVMGYGVNDDQTIAALLERQLNSAARATAHYEVLNFGVGQYWPIHRRAQIEHKVVQFRPDLIVYFAHQDELFHYVRPLAMCIEQGIDLEDSRLERTIERLGIRKHDREFATAAVLNRNLLPALRDTYIRIVELCQQAGVELLYVYLPMPGYFEIPLDPRSVLDIASAAGVDTVDLTGWDAGRVPGDLVVGGHDATHPNVAGVQLIVEQMTRALNSRDPISRTTAP